MMKKLVGALGLALLVLGMTAGTAGATHSNGNGPATDFSVGTGAGVVSTPWGTFVSQTHIQATADGQGGVGGRFWTRLLDTPPDQIGLPPSGEVQISGVIVCLNVVGNVALSTGRITETNFGFAPLNWTLLLKQVDNGNAAPDEQGGNLGAFGRTSCPQALEAPVTSPLQHGNFVVHDGI
jgi:hypothetical protein